MVSFRGLNCTRISSQVPFIVNTLWDALLDLDDLTASTNSIMTLLSLLLTYTQVRQCRSVQRW